MPNGRLRILSRALTLACALFIASFLYTRSTALAVTPAAAAQPAAAPRAPGLPRTADGRPNLQGIWQVRNTAAADLLDHPASHGMRAGTSVVRGNEIPYQPWARQKQ